MAELAAQGVQEQAAERGGRVFAAREARPVPATASLAADLEDPRRCLLVGTIDEVIVGYAAVRVEELRDGRRLGVIGDFYVEREARSVGVGEAMINPILDWCRHLGCAGIDGFTLPGNRHTKNFFETFGFTARAIVVHRALSDTDPDTDSDVDNDNDG